MGCFQILWNVTDVLKSSDAFINQWTSFVSFLYLETILLISSSPYTWYKQFHELKNFLHNLLLQISWHIVTDVIANAMTSPIRIFCPSIINGHISQKCFAKLKLEKSLSGYGTSYRRFPQALWLQILAIETALYVILFLVLFIYSKFYTDVYWSFRFSDNFIF